MRLKDITDQVFVLPVGPGPMSFTRHEPRFANPFSKSEVAEIIAANHSWGRTLENHPGIRLDSVRIFREGTILDLSIVHFEDFVSTNLLLASNRAFDSPLTGGKMREWLMHPNGKAVLADNSLSNLLTISFLLTDSTGRIGVVHRTNRVAVNPGFSGTTVTATPSLGDYESLNPILSCAVREAKEELNIERFHNLHFDGIIVGKQKMQPVVLLSAKIPLTWEEQLKLAQTAEDFELEVEELIPLTPKELGYSVLTKDYTVVARYHIAKFIGLV